MMGGAKTAPSPFMKMLVAMIPMMMGPSASSPQFLVFGVATRMAPMISMTLMKSMKLDRIMDLKNGVA